MAVLVCPNCKSILSEYDIHSDKVVCIQCNFDIDIKAGLVADLSKNHKASKGNEGISIQKGASHLNIELEWRHFSYWKFNFKFGLVFTVPSGTLLFFFASKSLLFAILGSVFLFAGVYFLYMAWFQYFNKTTINIKHTHLAVRHLYNSKRLQPIESIQNGDINQIFIRRKSAGSINGIEIYNHEIFLRTKPGKEHLMVNQIKEAAIAYAIENSIEEFLKIQDVIQLDEFHPLKADPINPNKLKTMAILAEIRSETQASNEMQPKVSSNIYKAQQFNCPKCKNTIPKEDTNLDKDLLYCSECHESFSMSESFGLQMDNTHKQFKEPPKKVKVTGGPNGITISFLRSKYYYLALLFPALFLIFFFGYGTQQFNSTFRMLIPIFLMYALSLLILTKQTIRLSGIYLWVDTFPNWHFGTKSTEFMSSTIKQVFVVRRVIESDDTSSIVYDLKFLDYENKEHILLKGHKNPFDLFFAESKIQSFLSIKDEPVTGEFSPNLQSIPPNRTELVELARRFRSRKK